MIAKKIISKTRINNMMKNKRDDYIVKTILEGKKKDKWRKIIQIIAGGRRRYSSINLDEIEKETKEGDTIVVAGKVLGSGDISKKIRVVSLYFSQSALEKLKKQKCETVSILEEIKVNPEARGIKWLK